jgi:hypothetical protein
MSPLPVSQLLMGHALKITRPEHRRMQGGRDLMTSSFPASDFLHQCHRVTPLRNGGGEIGKFANRPAGATIVSLCFLLPSS